MTIKAKKSKINLREKLAELLNFRQIRDRLDGLGLYLGKDRTGTAENLAVRGGANVDDLQLAEISAALGGTAVDVFVYDTRNDSDGGKWRERTSHTSWYNEELNTSTRGGRREFPAVAVIVAEAGRVTIYDGDDPDLSMWMVFEGTYLAIDIVNILTSDDTHPLSSVFALQGILCIGVSALNGFEYINFVDDSAGYYRASISGVYNGGILERNDGKGKIFNSGSFLVDDTVNDVAMTVLPNAPIDAETGLPIPTIAVATDGGVSVIKHDGNVVDITCSNVSFKYSYYVVFDQLNRLFFSLDGLNNSRRIWGLNDIPTDENFVVTADINEKQNGDIFIADDNGFGTATKDMFLFNQSNPHAMGFTSDNSIGTNKNLFKSFINQEDSGKSLHNYITSSYNTGWMPGDIKLATLSDTKNEKVGVDETELVTNGKFDTDGDWTKETGWTIDDGVALITGSVGDTFLQQTITVEAGKIYAFEAEVTSYTSGIFSLTFLGGTATVYQAKTVMNSRTSVGKLLRYLGATSSGTMTIIINANGATGSVDNVSFRQTGELITNGTFDYGIEGWIKEGSDLTNASHPDSGSDSLLVTPTASIGKAIQNVTTVSEKKYVLSAGIAFGAGCTQITIADNTGGIINEDYAVAGGSRTVTIDFNGSSSMYNLQLLAYDGPAYFDNISVRLAEEDRSVNDNGLQVFGEIDKTPVVPGADLVAYSGFSADNYLMQPYNSDLDFGTGDFSMMGWFKVSDMGSSTYSLVYRSSEAIDGNYYHCSLNEGKLKFARNDGTGEDYLAGSTDLDNNTWHHFCGVYEGGSMKIYVDGRADADKVTAVRTDSVNNSLAVLTLGIRPNSTQFLNGGSLALCRASATAPTAEQIAKIYRDEKALFRDGAQATLYGTSDAVTALAYDDKTELLHVGTSSGRSDFAGLRRINNTTIPITTSISASNNLIAEQ